MSGDYQLEDTVYLPFTTRAFNTGVPTALVSGEVQIYEDASITQITGAETLTVSLDGVAGFNMCQVDITAANGFETGKSYTGVLSAGTVDSVSVIGEVVFHFTIGMSAAVLEIGTAGAGLTNVTINDASVDKIWDEDIADHVAVGTFGEAGRLTQYSGPRGPGVYLDDAAGNTSVVEGEDGTSKKPVSTIAAAITIAGNIGVKRIYLVNDSAITLGATMEDYDFVGIGSVDGNSIALASQDVDGSAFFNLTITGVQGGTTRVRYEDCIFGTATLHCAAYRCGLSDAVTGITLSNNDDNSMDACFSMVAGNSAPILICSAANLDLSLRHYSGGIQFNTLNATATVSIETQGQVIFNADCNTSAAVTIRGNCTVTDNTGGMSSVTEGARIDVAQINAQVDSALDTAIGTPTAGSINDVLKDLEAILPASTLSTVTTAQVNTEMVDVMKTDTYAAPASATDVPAAPTLEEAIMFLYTLARNKRTETSTTFTLRNDGDSGDIITQAITDAAGTTTVNKVA